MKKLFAKAKQILPSKKRNKEEFKASMSFFYHISGFQPKISPYLCSSILAGCLAFTSMGAAQAGMLGDGSSNFKVSPHTGDTHQDYVLYTQLATADTPSTRLPMVQTMVQTMAQPMVQLAQEAETGTEEDSNDPLEGFNRAIFSFNEGFYDIVLGPLSDAYSVLPAPARAMVGGFLSNLSSPVVFANDILQGEPVRAFDTARRFVINTVFGFGGVADVATSFGIEKHNEDFGQTLAVWGAGEGFYLVLPILGPSNPRDMIGQIFVDPWIDPVANNLMDHGNEAWYWTRNGVNIVHNFSLVRDDLDQLESNSVDYYAAVRSLYRQQRIVAISNGDEMELPSIPDFEFGDFPVNPIIDNSLGNVDGITEGDQLSYNSLPNLGQGDLSINDPFATRFDPVENVAESGMGVGDVPMAPRKPFILSSLAAEDEMVVGSLVIPGAK